MSRETKTAPGIVPGAVRRSLLASMARACPTPAPRGETKEEIEGKQERLARVHAPNLGKPRAARKRPGLPVDAVPIKLRGMPFQSGRTPHAVVLGQDYPHPILGV